MDQLIVMEMKLQMKIRFRGMILGAVLAIIPALLIMVLTEINAPQGSLKAVGFFNLIAIFPLQVLANLISPDISDVVNLVVLVAFWGTIGFSVGKTHENKPGIHGR